MADLPSYLSVSEDRVPIDVFVPPGAAKNAIVDMDEVACAIERVLSSRGHEPGQEAAEG